MFAIDISFVAALLVSRPSTAFEAHRRWAGWNTRQVTSVWLGLMVIIGVVVAGSRSQFVADSVDVASPTAAVEKSTRAGEILGRSVRLPNGRRAVVLEPEQWVGKRLPLLPHVEPAELREWMSECETGFEIVVFRQDCDRCRKLLAQIAAQAPPNSPPVVLLEISSSRPWRSPTAMSESSPFKFGSLVGSIKWYATTPLILRMSGQEVVEIISREPSPSLLSEKDHE